MGNIKIFRLTEDGAQEMAGHCVAMEKDLQSLIEKNMERMFGIRFLASGFGTGRYQRGFVDSLGLDENNCPVIVEYKRRNNENIINQGLYYLDWLMDHKGDFALLAQSKLGMEAAANIEFSGARLLCVASSFNRFDEKAVNQIGRNIELVRYKFHGDDIFLLELLNSTSHWMPDEENIEQESPDRDVGMPVAMRQRIRNMSPDIERVYLELISFAETLGDDVSIRFLKHYIALARLRNFTCFQPSRNTIKLWVNLDPASVSLEEGFSRDVSEVGHHATGDLEIDLRNDSDLERAIPLIELAYHSN